MTKKELEDRVAALEAQLEEFRSFRADLRSSRDIMYEQLLRLQGSVEECDLILGSFDNDN